MSSNETRDVCSCKCVQHTYTHVVNNVLTYVYYAMSRSNHDCLVKVMENTFIDDEMVLAKKVLWDVGGVELLGKNINRTDSENRTKGFILCTDVIEGMQKLDQCGRPMPTFLCDANGVGRLPNFSPEDYNVVSLDERCRKLERLMRSVQQETTLRAEAWAKLEDQVDHMELAMCQHARHIHALQDSNVIRQSTSIPSVLRTQLTEPSHEDSVSANNMHKSVVVPNKTAQYCDVTKSHQESETQSLIICFK